MTRSVGETRQHPGGNQSDLGSRPKLRVQTRCQKEADSDLTLTLTLALILTQTRSPSLNPIWIGRDRLSIQVGEKLLLQSSHGLR